MKDRPTDLHTMLRCALAAQVELGLGEMIVDPVPTGGTEEEVAMRKQPDVARDLFGAVKVPMSEPQYESMEVHCQAICSCMLCPLGETRTKFVYGVGNTNADILFIGEAPGRDEDLQGEPFVGRAGQLLDKILTAMNLTRQQVYIANILKCRPPNNRDPLPEEMEKCFPYLQEQIRLIRPKVICALGRISGQALLKTTTPLGKLRGQWHAFEGVPMMITYNPAALLRFSSYKKATWEDMQMLLAKLNEI